MLCCVLASQVPLCRVDTEAFDGLKLNKSLVSRTESFRTVFRRHVWDNKNGERVEKTEAEMTEWLRLGFLLNPLSGLCATPRV